MCVVRILFTLIFYYPREMVNNYATDEFTYIREIERISVVSQCYSMKKCSINNRRLYLIFKLRYPMK